MRTIALGVATGLLLITSAANGAHATSITYNGFSSTTGLTFTGSAGTASTSDGTVLRLTPAQGNQVGAAYSTSAVTLGANDTFSTQFQFRFTNPSSIPADGITFVLAQDPTGLGDSVTGGMGYAGVDHSVAIEFDTYNNNSGGDSSNHVGIDVNGSLTDYSAANVYGIGTCYGSGAGCMSNGDLWTANIGYDGSNLNVSLSDPAEGAAFNAISNYGINLGSYLGTNTAHVGFTGYTGADFEAQDIVNWSFANTAQLSTTPLPATLPLFLSGLGILGVFGRRKKKASGLAP